jgi:hypothetical protein
MGKVITKNIMLLGKKLSILLYPSSNPQCPRMQGKSDPVITYSLHPKLNY